METLHFSIKINVPKERVWDVMLADETFRQWTNEFSPGSYYEGAWEQGSKIKFLDPSGSGMLSRIAENRPHEFISIEHYGFIEDGVEKTETPEAEAMAGAHENYTFQETDGVTEVLVDMDTEDEYKAMFEDAWPKALLKLKELCEK